MSEHWPSELMEVAKIRALLPQISLRLDVNRGWDDNQARGALITAMAYEVEWVEEPCQTLSMYADLPSNKVPIGLDESLATLQTLPLAKLLELTHASVVTLKPMAVGGLLRTAQLALEADSYGVDVCVTHMLGSVVERGAAAHLSAALRPNIKVKIGGLGGGLKSDLASPLPIYGGELRLSTRGGLAINLIPPAPVPRSLKPSTSSPTSDTPTDLADVQWIPHPLEMARCARPEHIALITSTPDTPSGLHSLSYEKLYQSTCVLADQLKRHFDMHPSHGSVALSGPLNQSWVICFHAITGIGVRVTPLNPDLTIDERHQAYLLADVAFDIRVERQRVLISSISLDDLSDITSVLKAELDLSTLTARSVQYVPESFELGQAPMLTPWGWERPLMTICTSGTSGSPQAISLNARQICSSAFGSIIRLGHQHDDVWLACLPTYHIGGLSILIRCLFNQITVRLCPPQANDIAEVLCQNQVSITSLTPTLLKALIDQLEGRDLERPTGPYTRLRALLVGGGPTSQHLWERAQSLNLPLKLTWGMSETASQVCTQIETLPPTEPLPPLPFAQVRADEHRRLWVSGPLTPNGLLATGDLGSVDERGVQIEGRADDVMISGGVNVSPFEVEEVLNSHSQISASAVIGAPHPEYGTRPVAFIVSETSVLDSISNSDEVRIVDQVDHHPSDQDLRVWCRASLSRYKTPDVFVWVNQLPRGPLGKLKRSKLRHSAAQALSDSIQHNHKRDDQVREDQ